MNEQYVKGAADKVAGKIKEFAGRVTGNNPGKEAIGSVKNAPSTH
jgi:uncharacterized protein YjbJ (UPF0337 family)